MPKVFNTVERQETERLLVWLALAAFFILGAWTMICVPMNNDEVMQYHLLNCDYYPFGRLAEKPQDCSPEIDLETPFGLHLIRSNIYTGLTTSLLYAPVYYLFHAQYAQYAFNLGFFFLFAFLLARLTRNPLLSFSLILSFFPFCFNFIHNMGPVCLAFLTFPAGALLLQRILRTPAPRSYIYGGLLAFMVFLAVEEKGFYFYLLPGYVFFLLAFSGETFSALGSGVRKAWRPLFFSALLFSFLLGELLLSTKIDKPFRGMYFINWLRQMMETPWAFLPHNDMIHATTESKWFFFLFFWPQYAARFFIVDVIDNSGHTLISLSKFLSLCLMPALLFVVSFGATMALYLKKQFKRLSPRVVFLFLAFVANIVAFSWLGDAWAGHHFVFLWVPLIVLFCDLLTFLNSKELALFCVLYLAASLVPMLWLSQAKMLYEVLPERSAIGAYFDAERSSEAIVDYESWGYDYIRANYGPTNQVIMRNALTKGSLGRALAGALKATGRDLYVVCHPPELDNSFQQLHGDVCTLEHLTKKVECSQRRSASLSEVLLGLKVWHVFKVTFKGDAPLEATKDCRSTVEKAGMPKPLSDDD